MKPIELVKKLEADKKAAKERFYKNPQNRENYGNKEHKPEEFKDKTFLFIRSSDTDNGCRPLPAGTAYWNSPDIELYDSAGTLIPTNQLVLNQHFTINVLVHNEGDMTCNSCIVELFICNPSIGFDRAHATQIGIQTTSVMGHHTATVSFPFTPGNENLGHQCLFARAYSYVSADMPISANQFNPPVDRHCGQQNLSIINQGTSFEFMVFQAKNIEPQKLTLKLTQNKAPLKGHKLIEINRFEPTAKPIQVNQFKFLKNISSDKKIVQTKNVINEIPEKNIFIRLFKYILSLFTKKKTDTVQNIEMIAVGNNTWKQEFTGVQNKVTLKIPELSLGKNEATQFEIEMINEKTGESIGGLTIIVKGS
jgi:hypothetical protein